MQNSWHLHWNFKKEEYNPSMPVFILLHVSILSKENHKTMHLAKLIAKDSIGWFALFFLLKNI